MSMVMRGSKVKSVLVKRSLIGSVGWVLQTWRSRRIELMGIATKCMVRMEPAVYISHKCRMLVLVKHAIRYIKT